MPQLKAQMAQLAPADGMPTVGQEDVDAVAAMSAVEQRAFIQSMMERLRTRLESNPEDAEGWAMLARAHAQMGNRSAAIDALRQGIASVDDQQKAKLRELLDNLEASPDF